ncbi:YncE family protein [Gilvimarinus xylanilyticus]|uniref:5-methyltetrahydrofolate--homocysteine methyltransferase n=1 Tax=Gilvimarinus xylanilyticus TaxID=2944139 RepID=A0A9X2I6X9_9GAMM|nr:hypothetical protein [Gilvimarinus xylanilyticus]MCP8900592.1 hypothetical protein [Gilvimarinus xylanilyticus]
MSLQNKMKPLSAVILALMLSACGDSETNIYAEDVAEPDHDEDHDHDHDELSQSRLLVVEAGTELAHVFDTTDGDEVASLTLPAPIGYAYSVPGNRYAAFVHRDDNWVSFVDGGVWTEDHGDHDHPYAEAPAIQDFFLDGVKPTHYTFNDEQVAVFYDGNSETGDPAGVASFDAHAVADNGMAATLTLSTHMHGAAQVRGEHLLATIRDADSASTLPEQVALYHLHDTEYEQEKVFAETCPVLHGSAQNENHIFFACGDGVLVIDESADFAASKVANGDALPEDARIGTLRGHDHIHDAVGWTGGTIVLVEPDADTLETLSWENSAGASVVSGEFADSGELFVTLLDNGSLVVFDSHDWSVHGEVEAVDASVLGEDQRLKLVVEPQGHTAYIVNPGAQSVALVDLEVMEVSTKWELDFTPLTAAWVGYAEEHEEGEDHDHEQEHDHEEGEGHAH